MKIQLNGEDRDVTNETTLATLIRQLDLGKVRVAVERNFEIVPRDYYSDTMLADGDRLEIVTFVGGG